MMRTGLGLRSTLCAGAVALAVYLFGPVSAAPASAAEAPSHPPTAYASVIEGQTAPIAAYPWLAHVEYEVATGPWICSGTVIAPRVVLTAAHCAEEPASDGIASSSTYKVITGIANVTKARPADISSVSQVVVYPQFSTDTKEADAGLLILSKPVTATPLALATKEDFARLEAGEVLDIAGWGATHRQTIFAPAAFHVGNTILGGGFCGTRFANPFQLCAVSAPGFLTIACFGDSGGPLLAHRSDGSPVEVGIFSLVGTEDCNPGAPVTYARVDRVSAWAARWIAAVEDGAPPPALREQRVHLPYLSSRRAEWIAIADIDKQLAVGLQGPVEGQFECKRQAKARVHCNVAWRREANDLYGHVTVYFEISGDEVLWHDHFAIHWTNHHCRSHILPDNCTVYTQRG